MSEVNEIIENQDTDPSSSKQKPRPPKPDTGDYGYKSGFKLKPCTSKELKKVSSEDGFPGVHWVWTPETDTLVPPDEVPFLFESVKARRESAAHAFYFIGGLTILTGLMQLGFSCERTSLSTGELAENGLITGLLNLAMGPWALAMAAWTSHQAQRLTPEILNAERKERLEKGAPWQRASYMIFILPLLMAVLSIVQWRTGIPESLTSLGQLSPYQMQGEYWRLVTSVFVHGSFMHISMSLMGVIALALVVEQICRGYLTPIIFVISALAGGAMAMLFVVDGVSVGASGGISGLWGFIVMYGLRHWKSIKQEHTPVIIMLVAAPFAVGVTSYFYVSNAVYLGGVLAGAMLEPILVGGKEGLPIEPGLVAKAAGIVSFTAIIAIAAYTIILLV
jgi:membrane associated rhomboid family serine protease